MSANPPRQANRLTYTILVCPHSGKACTHDQHGPVPIEVVPVGRVRELEAARDLLSRELKTLRESRSAFVQIGEVTLFGDKESIAKARWTIEHLKGKRGAES